MNEIAKDLADSIREQRSTGSGARHKAPSKRGPRGAVKTPVDTMTAQERREYTNSRTGGDETRTTTAARCSWMGWCAVECWKMTASPASPCGWRRERTSRTHGQRLR